MCLDDKEIIEIANYNEDTKEYKEKKHNNYINDFVEEMYKAGNRDMKARIENMLLQSIIELKENPVLEENLNDFKIGVVESIFKIIKEMEI